MFRLHLDVGKGKMMVMEFAKGLIHYLDEADGTVVVMGPLQPGESIEVPMDDMMFIEDVQEVQDGNE
jgi:hypothetical protein